MSARIDEVAPDLFKLTTYVPQIDLQFSQFLLRDEEPLLFETGMRGLLPEVLDAVAKLIPPSSLRWVAFSHFEPDECGSLNEWLAIAPRAQAACSLVGAEVYVNDGALRPARALAEGEALVTGRHRLRWLTTPHVPHGWDAGLLFDETTRALLCSDLLIQSGDVEPVARDAGALLERVRASQRAFEQGPFARATPGAPWQGATLERLAALAPRHLATMHGSTLEGDGGAALRALAGILAEVR